MTMRNKILILFLLLLTSCELPFDLTKLGDRDMLKLYCEVVSGDTTVLDIDVLVPVGYHERTPSQVGAEDVVMTVDGKEVGIKVAADDDPNLDPGTLYVRERFPVGSEICVKACVEGADPIEAKTTMPLQLDDYRMEMQLTDIVSGSYYGNDVRDMVKARLILPEIAEGMYVGVQYVLSCKADSSGVTIYDDQYLQAVYDVTEFSSDGNLVSGVDFSNLTQMGNTGIYVWNGTDSYALASLKNLPDGIFVQVKNICPAGAMVSKNISRWRVSSSPVTSSISATSFSAPWFCMSILDAASLLFNAAMRF